MSQQPKGSEGSGGIALSQFSAWHRGASHRGARQSSHFIPTSLATLGQFILVDLASRALLKESDLASRCRGSRLLPPRPRVLECLTQPGSVKQGTRAPGHHAQLGRVLENNLSFEDQSLSPHPTPDCGVWRAGTHLP